MPALRLSRLEYAPVEQDDEGRTFLDVPDPIRRDVLLRGASRFIAGQGDTPWSIAWRHYRDTLDRESDFRPSSLFDVVAEANDLVDPLAPIPEGTAIFVPTLEVIFSEVRVPPTFFRRNATT